MAGPGLTVETVTAVYAAVEPSHFDEALASLAVQTRPPLRCVVVADGPLTEGLEAVLERYAGRLPLHVVRLPTNAGSGPARQAGLEASRADVVAVADADDISLPERLERQLAVMEEQGVDLLGAAVSEFDDATGETLGLRVFPTGHDELVARLGRVNPLNHPTVCMRRAVALEVGGYPDLPLLEDYDLCARIAASGARLGNLSEPLVRFRGGSSIAARRRARGMWRQEWRLQRNLVGYGLVSRPRAVVNWASRTAFRMLPEALMRRAYRRIFLTSA